MNYSNNSFMFEIKLCYVTQMLCTFKIYKH